MAVAVWAREASPGGLSVSETDSDSEDTPGGLSGLGRRGVKRPAAAAKHRGAEMNETHGTSLVPLEGYLGISQDMQVYDYYPDLSRVTGRVMPV